MEIFLGSSYNGLPTGELQKREVESFQDFCDKYLSTCVAGAKNEYYITIGDTYELTKGDKSYPELSYKSKDHYHRNNQSQRSAWLLPFDGDNSRTNPGCCIEPEVVHSTLCQLGFNHVIYTTHSHEMHTKNRWRLFLPCKMERKEQLNATVSYLYKLLVNNGCANLGLSTESKTWSIPWFLPTRDDPTDGHFQYYAYFEGRDFQAVEVDVKSGPGKVALEEESRTITQMLETIAQGTADTGLHRATRNLAYGLVKDGLSPNTVKAILHFVASSAGDTPRAIENKNKIDPLVDSAVDKIKEEIAPTGEWDVGHKSELKAVTQYPPQGGTMEELIKTCLQWMPFPNRQIAVIAAHTLISVLGGRVYTLESGSGIVLTALVTGRSTIGKSFIKKFCIFCLNNFQLAGVSQEFIGSHFYTSSKNLVDELREAGSLLSVRTESGQSDKSNAGDMTRVLMYELELATESGSRGYVSSGGQNDKIPRLFSPAVTTIRESVAQIQNEADMVNATAISGVAGRRSHVLIDPIKAPYNDKQLSKLPSEIKDLLKKMYILAANEQRKKIEDPLPTALWVIIPFKNPVYITKKRVEWLKKDNRAAQLNRHFEATFWGRMGERLPSWAARLAIADNPECPIITDAHIDIAEKSLVAELNAAEIQQESGELDGDVGILVTWILENLFAGKMINNKTLASVEKNQKILKDGGTMMHLVFTAIRSKAEYKAAYKNNPRVHDVIIANLKTRGIVELSIEEAQIKYNYRGRILMRT